MKVLSLFDGMACGMIAMKNVGIQIDRYVAYEIDKYAVKTATHNFPMIEEYGDVFSADFTQYKGFDCLVGGSPCTYWSIAQKSNRETEASGIGWELFSQYVRALHEVQPKYFIYENNKSMSTAIHDSIREAFGFEEICINSSLVSAQNRQRYYWVGKLNDDGTYSKVNIEQPQDKGILLKDILESGLDLTSKAEPIKIPSFVENKFDNAIDKYGYIPNMYNPYNNKEIKEKAPTQTAQCSIWTNSSTIVITEPVRVGCMPSPDGTIKGSQGNRVYSIDGKAVNQVANGGGLGAKTGLYAVPFKSISFADGKEYPVYTVKDGQITIKDKQYPIKLKDGYYIIRKLTVTECKRLQTVPDWYEFPVSNSQAYKMLGNGWTVDVIAHILRGLN